MDPHVSISRHERLTLSGCVLAYAECSPPSCPWHLPHDISTRSQTKSGLLDVVRRAGFRTRPSTALASVGPAAHLERELGPRQSRTRRIAAAYRAGFRYAPRRTESWPKLDTVQDLISALGAVNGSPGKFTVNGSTAVAPMRTGVAARAPEIPLQRNRGWASHRANDSRRVAASRAGRRHENAP